MWYLQSTATKIQQVNLELSADHNYCRVPSKQVECQSRLGFQECNRPIQLETSSESLPENNQTLSNSNSRSVCLQALSPNSQIHGMEARSKQFCNRSNAAGLEQNVFCIPTIQLDRSSDKHGSRGKCGSNDTSECDTHIADTTLVYSPTKNVHTMSIAFTNPPKPITKSPGRKISSCENEFPKVSCVENYRKNLEIERISSSAVHCIKAFEHSLHASSAF